MVPPLIYGAIILAFPRMMNNRVPAVTGRVAVDRSNGAGDSGRTALPRPAGDRRAPRRVVQQGAESSPIPGAAGGPGGGGGRSAPCSARCRSSRLSSRRCPRSQRKKARLVPRRRRPPSRRAGHPSQRRRRQRSGSVRRVRPVRAAEPRQQNSERDSKRGWRCHRRRAGARRRLWTVSRSTR